LPEPLSGLLPVSGNSVTPPVVSLVAVAGTGVSVGSSVAGIAVSAGAVVALALGPGASVSVDVAVGVFVGVLVAVAVGVSVAAGVSVGVAVGGGGMQERSSVASPASTENTSTPETADGRSQVAVPGTAELATTPGPLSVIWTSVGLPVVGADAVTETTVPASRMTAIPIEGVNVVGMELSPAHPGSVPRCRASTGLDMNPNAITLAPSKLTNAQ
jgi:hypothetical protein